MTRFTGGMRIRDGKILQVLASELPRRQGIINSDLKGMHVIPGLIDAHRHFFISALLPLSWRCEAAGHPRHDALEAIEAACRANGPGQALGLLLRHGPRQVEEPCPSYHRRDRCGSPWIRRCLLSDTTCHQRAWYRPRR
ncbi:MAG: hypothetical protein MZU91_13480 [Desulfosudis oleivorans]|nr:hypothetical protein [Desulfosudis oleivorans]